MNSIFQDEPPSGSLNSVNRKIELADEYLSAFDILTESAANISAILLPMMFLLSHAFELLLKSHVEMATGKNPRSYNHRLSDLWADSKKFGLLNEIPTSEEYLDCFVQSLKTGHEHYEFRYSEKSFSFSDPTETAVAIRKVRQAIFNKVSVQLETEKQEASREGFVLVSLPAGFRGSVKPE